MIINSLGSQNLELAIIRHPLIVSPATLVTDVVTLMSQGRGYCNLPFTESEYCEYLSSEVNTITPMMRTSCVLVMADSHLIGILTEQDLVKLAAQGKSIQGISVAQVMTKQLVTLKIGEFKDIFTALDLLRQHDIRHLPILGEQEELIGLVTAASLRSILRSSDLLKIRRVGEVMNTQLIYTAPNASVLDVARLMSKHQVSCVVIVEQSQDEQEPISWPVIPLGIITEYDLVQFQALELDFTQTQVRTIMSSPLFYLRPEDSLWLADEQMQSLRVRQLVVVGNQGELLGILTQSHILQVLDPIEFYELMKLLQHQVSQQQTRMVELLADRRQLEEQLQQRIIELKARTKREQLITSIALRIRESLDLDTALMTVAEDVRYVLKADRILVYQFAPDMSGKILAESVSNGWTTALSSEIKNISLSDVEDIYVYGKKQAIANIYELNLTDHHLQILEQLQVKACLVVPILISNQLWGLLIAHQCSNFREWKEDEVNLLDKIAIQLSVAIKQVELYNQARIQLAERHKIEAQLRWERNFISTVLNVADALIVVLDYQFRIVKFNHACEQTTGYTYDWVQGKLIWDFLLISEEIEPVKAAFKNLKQRQIRNHHENHWLTKDGDNRLISWSNNVLLNCDDQVEYIVCTGIDITENRKAEEELRHTRNFLQSMIDNLPVGVFVKDARPEKFGKFQLLNKACEHIFGLTGEHAIGKTDYDFFPEEQAEFFLQKDIETISHGLPQDIPEEPIDSYSLGRRILHTKKVPLYDKYGQPEYLLCISEDITERKQAEEKLRQAKEQLQTVLDAVPGFVSWVSSDGRYLGVNKRLAQSFNLTPDAFIGQELGFMQKSPHFTEFMRDFLANQDVAASSVIDSQIGDTKRSYLLVAQKYQQNTAAVTVGIDITERKQTEIALQNLIESTASTTGQDFFPALVQYISSALDVRYACVSELINEQLYTLGFWCDGQLKPNIFYDPRSKPCNILLQQGVYYCCYGIQQLFPNVEALALMQADSFMGVTLSNDFGEPIGTLWIVDEKPITDPHKFEGILKVFAARAAAELQRQRAQEALQKLNRELESRVEQRTLELQKSEAELKRQFAAVEAAIDGIAILSQDTYTYINKAHVEMFGYTHADELIGKSWQEIYEKSEIHRFQTEFFPVLIQQKHWRGETIAKRKDGTTFDEEVSLTISEQGDLICVCRDISQRKEAERLIEEQRTFLRSIIDNNPNFIFVKDTTGKFLLVNKAMASFHNTTIQGMVGKADTEFYTDAELQGFKNFDQAVLTRLQPIQLLESSTKKATGEQRYFQSIKVPLIASNGEVRGVLGVATDITERKLAQDALQQQIEREKLVNFITRRISESLDLQAILNVAVAEIHKLLKVDRVLIYHILTDGTGKVIAEALTPGYESILEQSFPVECFPTKCYLRYAQGEIYTLHDREERQQPSCLMQFMEDMQIRAKLVIPILQQGTLWGLLIAHQCSHPREWKTGEIELLQQLADQLAIATKQSGLYAQLQVELSDRKQAETELRQVKERLEFLISSSPAVIFTAKPLTINYYHTYISENIINLVGYSTEEFLSEPDFWLNHIHPEDATQIVENLPQLIQTGHHTQEYRWLHRDGKYRWMFDQLKLVRDQHGNPLEIIGLWMEISDRKKAEEDIRKALEKEKELSDLKSRFVAMTSHEFRTPLAVIASSAGILKSFSHKLDNQQQQKHLQCIQTYVQHTTRLLDDILLINKAEAGKLAFEPTDIDLNDFCCSLVEELQLSSPNHTLIFSTQYLGRSPADNHFTAHLDKKLLRQMLSNLLSNAVKYSPDGSNVQIDLLIQDESAVFLITDEGIGISKQEQQNLFESFYRASNVGNIPGTGLGLTIVKKCAELQGGQITVTSEIGAGTTFRVELPLFTSK
ncbi:MAG: PAS domain S-box protein [Nostochopsis sp.]